MLEFLQDYWSTILIGAVLLAAVVFAVVKMCKNKRSGKGCCGDCSKCGGCSSGKDK